MEQLTTENLNHILPTSLANMITQNKLVHAMLIETPNISNRQEIIIAVACSIVCKDKQDGMPCLTCLACQKVVSKNHYDITYVEDIDPKYKIDSVRGLKSQMQFAPHEANFKVYVFENAQNMSPNVQSVMLKFIEEPPPDTYFILTAPNKNTLLPTILSRVVVFNVGQTTYDQCLIQLESLPEVSQQDKQLATILTHNNPTLAQQLLLDSKQFAMCSTAHSIFSALKSGGYPLISAMVPAEKSKDSYGKALEYVSILVDYYRADFPTKQLLAITNGINIANKQNNINCYLPLISALFAENTRPQNL